MVARKGKKRGIQREKIGKKWKQVERWTKENRGATKIKIKKNNYKDREEYNGVTKRIKEENLNPRNKKWKNEREWCDENNPKNRREYRDLWCKKRKEVE